MNQNIISIKLLGFAVVLSLFILSSSAYIRDTSQNSIGLCNSENTVTTVITINNYSILINPAKADQTIECLGRILPFYDRDINLVVTRNGKLDKLILNYYEVNKVISDKQLHIIDYKVDISDNLTMIFRNNKTLLVARKPIKSMINLGSIKYGLITIIRPKSDEIIEEKLNTLQFNQNIIQEGTVKRIVL